MRPLVRTGIGVAALLFTQVGCETEPPPPPSDPELRMELGIADEVTIHRIDLSGRGSVTRVLPPEVSIRGGDIVQFIVLDNRVHLIAFETDRMSADGRRFMEDTDQDRPPPLVEQGARLVLSFEGAPPGRYPFRITGNGADVPGAVIVMEDDQE